MTRFEEGYMAAIRAEIGSDAEFHPSTLAAILKDCGEFLAHPYGENDSDHGRRFWQMRVRRQIGGGWHPDFPPLTPCLGDDGKVHLTSGAS